MDVSPVSPVTSADAATVSPDVAAAARFDVALAAINDAIVNFKTLQTNVKQMQKDFARLVKAAGKKTKRTAGGAGGAGGEGAAKKNPSGFAKPTGLSDAMCEFLGVPTGTELARTDVTRRLNQYIKENNLQDEQDKRKIHPDAKLGKILTISEGNALTFFNLQSFIKHNFLKA